MENLEDHCKKIEFNSLNLGAVFKFCPEGIVSKDSKLCYLDANESYAKIFASNKFKSIVGKRSNPYVSDSIMKLVHDADNEVMRSLRSINYVITLENETLLNITTFPILCEGKFQGLISIIKDITQEEAIKEDREQGA